MKSFYIVMYVYCLLPPPFKFCVTIMARKNQWQREPYLCGRSTQHIFVFLTLAEKDLCSLTIGQSLLMFKFVDAMFGCVLCLIYT